MPNWDDLYSSGRPRTRRSQDMLNRHLERTGADKAARTDATAHLQVQMLRQFLDLVDAALEDEHVGRDVAIRVIDRLIYGAVPNPVEVAQRDRLMRSLAELARMPTKLVGPVPADRHDEMTRGLDG